MSNMEKTYFIISLVISLNSQKNSRLFHDKEELVETKTVFSINLQVEQKVYI